MKYNIKKYTAAMLDLLWVKFYRPITDLRKKVGTAPASQKVEIYVADIEKWFGVSNYQIGPILEFLEAILNKLASEKILKITRCGFLVEMPLDATSPEYFHSRPEYEDTAPPLFNITLYPAFKKYYEEIRCQYPSDEDEQKTTPETTLASKDLHFEDDEAAIYIMGKKCALPPYKNEHDFCRAMFKRPVDKFIDWSVIYEEMTGGDFENSEKDKRIVQDTMYRINKRIKKFCHTDNDLFTWKIKTVKRNY